jgi:hypothetical protein
VETLQLLILTLTLMTLLSCIVETLVQTVDLLTVQRGGLLVKHTSVRVYTINDNALGLQQCDPFALFCR